MEYVLDHLQLRTLNKSNVNKKRIFVIFLNQIQNRYSEYDIFQTLALNIHDKKENNLKQNCLFTI